MVPHPPADVTVSDRPVELVPVPDGATVEQAAAIRHAVPSFNRTMRIALAMRGGVSLAVWIGGAVAELDLIRRIRLYDGDGRTFAFVPEPAGRPLTPPVLARLQAYAEMLDAAGFDRVEFDLLAGASAGGLNAVVYAVAQRAGTVPDRLIETWAEVGGFWGLLHPPGSRGIVALMQGEGHFRPEVLGALTTTYATTERHPDLVAEYTSVDLSATVIDGDDEYEEDANEGRGHFRFVGSDDHLLDNRIPRRHDEIDETRELDDRASLERLALAARSTSSLAGGFEPALIDSWNGEAGDPEAASERGMRFAFAAHREQSGTPYRIVDGAVFDNVPIERALRSARTRVSRRRADRVMLFLDPEPDPPVGGATEWDPDASRFFRAIRAMVSKQMRSESVAREVAELERFNAERLVAAARLDSAAPLVATAPWTQEAVQERRAAYVHALGADLADHLAETISAPSLWQLSSTLPTRRRYRPIPRLRLAALGPVLRRRFSSLNVADTAKVAKSPLALADAANCVLGWARALETMPERQGGRQATTLGDVRDAAYDALAAATGWRDELTARVLQLTDRAAANGGTPTADEVDAWVDAWLTASARIRTIDQWDALDNAVARLRIASARIEREAKAGQRRLSATWSDSAWRPLASTTSLSAVDLPPLYHAAGIPAALSHVRYWAIGVDEMPDDPASFRTLATERRHRILGRGLRSPGRSAAAVAAEVRAAAEHPVIDRQTKLAGYGFGNFYGFLAREWRLNDWWWGRMDAAAGLARFFTSLQPERMRTDAAVRLLQDAVLAEADLPENVDSGLSPLEPAPPADEPAARVAETTLASPESASPAVTGAEPAERDAERAQRRARLRAGTDTVLNLAPAYRFAIASRTVRLLVRVLVQPIGFAGRIFAQAVLALLRPLLVALPAVADPPRLALLAGFVAAVAWPLTWQSIGTPSPGWAVVVVVVALIAVGSVWGGVGAVQRRWARVAEALGGPLEQEAQEARKAASARAYIMAGVTTASVGPLVIALLQGNLLLIVLCIGVTVVLGGIARRLASASRRAAIPGRDRRTIAMLVAFALLGGVLPVALWWLDATDRFPAWLETEGMGNLPILCAGAVPATLTLTIGWLRIGRGWNEIRDTRLVNWTTVTAASVAVAALAYWLTIAYATADLVPLLAESIAALVFLVVWATLLWWLPERVHRAPRIDDEVIRAPLA
jgi:patatin-related protein